MEAGFSVIVLARIYFDTPSLPKGLFFFKKIDASKSCFHIYRTCRKRTSNFSQLKKKEREVGRGESSQGEAGEADRREASGVGKEAGEVPGG